MIKYLILIFSLGLVSCKNSDSICSNKFVDAELSTTQLSLEVACTLAEKKQGLMFRNSLGKNNGMIFVYDKEDYHSFWMKNTNIPLSIAFLNKDKIIVDIQNMKAQDLTPVTSRAKALYAIEMNLDWFKVNNIIIAEQLKIN